MHISGLLLFPAIRTMPASLGYVAPFAVLLGLVALGPGRWLSPAAGEAARVAILAVVLAVFARNLIPLRAVRWVASVAVGLGVFLIWIVPDLALPGWHLRPVFSNALTGSAAGSFPEAARSDAAALAFRSLRAAVLVPLIEELFWRGWLPRWLQDPGDFRRVPAGSYTTAAFWLTALLFASEHGPLWDVGLLAGIVYNWWMRSTRSLGDAVLAHAVTNACLSGYVMLGGRWEYW